MDWVDAVERLGVSGALLVVMILTVRYYLGPWFASFLESHNHLVSKLTEAIDRQEEHNANQTELLRAISADAAKERELVGEVKDGIKRLEDHNAAGKDK